MKTCKSKALRRNNNTYRIRISINYVCTSFLSGAKASICLKCCSERMESSQANMASFIFSNGSFKWAKRMAALIEPKPWNLSNKEAEFTLTDIVCLSLFKHSWSGIFLCCGCEKMGMKNTSQCWKVSAHHLWASD